ncbi:MAG: type II toxin-antitoxin system death-on-curing family toxin [Acidimicrobiia bacterium]
MSSGVQYLDLGDFLVIAGAALNVEAEALAHQCDLHLADSALNAPRAGFGEVEFYPDFATKAAVLCWHVIRNHPLPDGNKRTGYLCMTEFVERNGRTWSGTGDPHGEETVEMMVGVASGAVSATALADWVRDRIDPA